MALMRSNSHGNIGELLFLPDIDNFPLCGYVIDRLIKTCLETLEVLRQEGDPPFCLQPCTFLHMGFAASFFFANASANFPRCLVESVLSPI